MACMVIEASVVPAAVTFAGTEKDVLIEAWDADAGAVGRCFCVEKKLRVN